MRIYIFLFLSCLATTTWAEDDKDVTIPVEQEGSNFRRVERDLQALQAFVYRHLGSEESPSEALKNMPKDAASLIFDKVMGLQNQFTKIMGRLEELEHKIKQGENESQILKDMEARLRQLENKGDRQTDTGISREEKVSEVLSPEQLYEQAQSLFKKGEMVEAESVLRQIHKRLPESLVFKKACLDLVVLMEKKGEYKEAAFFAMEVYKKDPQSQEAHQALLKMAEILNKIGESTKACIILDKLLHAPDVLEALKVRGETLKKELSCV